VKRQQILLAIALILISGSTLLARNYAYVARSWENPDEPMATSLSIQVPVVHYDQNGHAYTSYETRWIHVTVRTGNEAPLRLGEIEYFRVSAYASGSSVNVHVDPELVYHSYSGAWGSAGSYGGYVRLRLYHNGRIKNLPPVTFKNATVDFTTPDAPFTMGFEDFAYTDNTEAITSYGFEIKRSVFIFADKLVAKGEFPRPTEGQPTLVLTSDSPFVQEGEEYFKVGKKYVVKLKLIREGSEYYSDKWSLNAEFSFKWTGEGPLVLEREDSQDPKHRTRNEKFENIYEK